MRIVAFAGPSLPRAARAGFDGVEWRPPAQAGDLLRLALRPDLTICLIDGYFDHRPAVRHKEISLLLSRGVRVLGASSIGALRAAEMDRLGMIGIGAIYRGYARGSIVADDEVALIHADAEQDWKALSVPLVDVRATLRRARAQAVLSRREAKAILKAARNIHYVDRVWASLVEADAYPAFRRWLRTGRVEQKRIDALECLRAAAGEAGRPAAAPDHARTAFLDALARECGIDLETHREEDQDGRAADAEERPPAAYPSKRDRFAGEETRHDKQRDPRF
jgi:hypothetical protein